MAGWLDALWAQAFRDERVIEPARFLRGNVVIGLFAIIALTAGARDPERMPPVFSALLVLTLLTHLSGIALAAALRRATAAIIFVQGLCLWATTAAAVVLSTYLTLHAARLSNVRYLPGITLALFMYASFEIHFFAPPGLRLPHVRKLSMVGGIVAELAMAAALIWRLVHG
jgi:hypothetical protein